MGTATQFNVNQNDCKTQYSLNCIGGGICVCSTIQSELNSLFGEGKSSISRTVGDLLYIMNAQGNEIGPIWMHASMHHLFPNTNIIDPVSLGTETIFLSQNDMYITQDGEQLGPLLLDPQDQSTIWKKNVNDDEVFVTQKHGEYLRVMKRNGEVLGRYKNDDGETLSQKWSIMIGNTTCSGGDITYEEGEHKIELVSEENISFGTYALDASDFLLKSITVGNQIRYCARTAGDYIWLRDENNQEIGPFMRKTMSFADIGKTIKPKDYKTIWSFNVYDQQLFVSSAEYPFVNLIKNTGEIRGKVMVDPENHAQLLVKKLGKDSLYVSKREGEQYFLIDSAGKELGEYTADLNNPEKILEKKIGKNIVYVSKIEGEQYFLVDSTGKELGDFLLDLENEEKIREWRFGETVLYVTRTDDNKMYFRSLGGRTFGIMKDPENKLQLLTKQFGDEKLFISYITERGQYFAHNPLSDPEGVNLYGPMIVNPHKLNEIWTEKLHDEVVPIFGKDNEGLLMLLQYNVFEKFAPYKFRKPIISSIIRNGLFHFRFNHFHHFHQFRFDRFHQGVVHEQGTYVFKHFRKKGMSSDQGIIGFYEM